MAASLFPASPFRAAAQGNSAPQDNASPEVVSTLDKPDWVDKALSLPPTKGWGEGVLQMGRFRDPIYYLKEPISWTPGEDDPAGLPTIHVPRGFVTDLASIPRPFFSFLRPDGDYVYAAVLHDYLYWMQTTSRDTADTVLRIVMQDFEVPSLTIAAIYNAVHYFGKSAWSNNHVLRGKGEKRVLSKTPTDPLIKWDDWKKKAGVFT